MSCTTIPLWIIAEELDLLEAYLYGTGSVVVRAYARKSVKLRSGMLVTIMAVTVRPRGLHQLCINPCFGSTSTLLAYSGLNGHGRHSAHL